MPELKITVLMENKSEYDSLCCEHGLALYLCYRGHAVLLDAGQSGLFVENAAALDCPLDAIEFAVLSHGHYDHANGFVSLLEKNKTLRVYARTSVMEERFNRNGRFNGLEQLLREEFRDQFDLSDELRELLPGLWLVPDNVNHEQSLVAETKRGLVVINSCCHAGGDNIVASILEHFPGKRVRALIGGLHLMEKPPERVRELALNLIEKLGVDTIFTGHCTGEVALELLNETVPGCVRHIHTGHVLEF